MENAENTARLPSSVKRILWILLAVLILALGAVIGWYVLHFRNYDAYKAIPQHLRAMLFRTRPLALFCP